MTNPVVHFEIQSQQPGRLTDFYSDLFGWTIHPPNGDDEYRFITTGPERGDVNGGIMPADAPHETVTFYVSVEDIGAMLENVEELGGSVIMAETPIGSEMSIGFIADPQGNRIGLIHYTS